MSSGGGTTSPPRLLVVQHEPGTGSGWWGEWLAASGLGLDVRHPYRDGDLPSLETYDGMLVLGGAMGPTDDDACPWLPQTRARLADAVSSGLPTVGICLGAELLTVACGGRVERGASGPELGVLALNLEPGAAQDRVLGALPAAPRVLQWHWEAMTELPPGAVNLASSPAYPHQAFRLGARAWGVQGHPEVTPQIAAEWAREDSPLLVAAGRAPADLVAELTAATDELVATWAPVAAAFAAVVHDQAGHPGAPHGSG